MAAIHQAATMSAAEIAKKLTVLDSLHTQKKAWNRVTSAKIVNCCRWASYIEMDSDASNIAPNLTAAKDTSLVQSDDVENDSNSLQLLIIYR